MSNQNKKGKRGKASGVEKANIASYTEVKKGVRKGLYRQEQLSITNNTKSGQ